MAKDSTMWMASCSKFPTTIAAMQCVERGLLQLDDDVTEILPELKGLKVLSKFDEGDAEPTLVENTKSITLKSVLCSDHCGAQS
jgi:CubicO group peptidase (beta-lactamase class C family)